MCETVSSNIESFRLKKTEPQAAAIEMIKNRRLKNDEIIKRLNLENRYELNI